MKISNVTLSVLNNLAKSCTADLSMVSSCMFMTGGAAGDMKAALGQMQNGKAVEVSGYIAPASSVVTTQNIDLDTNVGISFPNSNISPVWVGNGDKFTIPAGLTIPNWPSNGFPLYGDPPYNGGTIYPPLTPTPFLPQVPFGPIKIIPALEELEEGVHDIPGGKIIIKKIKVTDEQLDGALSDVLEHEATDEEKAKLRQELQDITDSEERDV